MGITLKSSKPINVPLTWTETDNNFSYLLTNMSGSTVAINGSTSITGSLTTSGSSTSLIVAGTASLQTVTPQLDNAYDLGNSNYRFRTIYATSISGSSSSSTSASFAISASNLSAAITNNTNNYVLTATGGGGINGEANLTFDGTTLVVNGKLNNGSGSIATGNYSHTEGYLAVATGNGTHAEGYDTTATGNYSHAEGEGTTAVGVSSHAEGSNTTSTGDLSHAEGYNTTAIGSNSHAEGEGTTSTGDGSHAEGLTTVAFGSYSHAEGYSTRAVGDYSHAEGYYVSSSGAYSHAEGSGSRAFGIGSHAEGASTLASSSFSNAGGIRAVSDHISEWSRGDSTLGQYGIVSLSTQTSGNSELSIGGNGSDYFTIPSQTAYALDITVMVAGLTAGSSPTKAFSGNGIIVRADNGSGDLVYLAGSLGTTGSIQFTPYFTSSYNVTVNGVADNTNKRLSLSVTGSDALSCVAKIEYIKINGLGSV
jgi:hypothetical protein